MVINILITVILIAFGLVQIIWPKQCAKIIRNDKKDVNDDAKNGILNGIRFSGFFWIFIAIIFLYTSI